MQHRGFNYILTNFAKSSITKSKVRGILKNSHLDLFRYINLWSILSGYSLSLAAAWVIDPHLAYAMCLIGMLLIAAGEKYAERIYHSPIPETYKSVVWGCLLFGAGTSAVSVAIIVTGSNEWLHPLAWLWAVGLAGGPQIHWQRRKIAEQAKVNKIAASVISRKLKRGK